MKHSLPQFQFSFVNKADDSADIYIDGVIVDADTQQILKDWFGDETSVSYKSFRNQLESSSAKTYNVYINSAGGMVTDAMAMHDMLVDMQTKGKTVNTYGRGLIASAATFILMAGNNAEMSKNSWFMIHNVSGGVYGSVDELEQYAATTRKMNDQLRDFYSSKTGMRKEDISKMMNAETWLTADEAKAKGFIKNISGDANFKNSIKADQWPFANKAILNSYNSSVKTDTDPQSFFTNQFNEMKKFFQNAIDKLMGLKPAAENTAITGTQIAEALKQPFEDIATELENSSATNVTTFLNSDAGKLAVKNAVDAAFKTAVNDAVAEAVKPLNTKIGELETSLNAKTEELETEVSNVAGGKANAGGKNNGEGAKKPIGNFKVAAKD